jgi:hypothetical protein
MAATPTDRFAIYRWTLDTDEFNRDQMDTSHRNIEERGAVLYQGITSARADISVAARERAFFYDTTTQTLSYYDSANGEWQSINGLGTTGQLVAIDGGSPSAGTAEAAARADHKHQLTFNNGISPSDITTAAAVGSAITPARADHTHAVADGTITAPKIAAAVAGQGLSKTSTALDVNTDNSTLEISGDSLRVKDGGLSNSQNSTGYRNLRTGTSQPSTQIANGDLWVSPTDYQIRQYTSAGWTAQPVLDRRPAVKIRRAATDVLIGDGGIPTSPVGGSPGFRIVFTEVVFPLTSPESTPWFVTNDTTGAFGIKAPYTGFYLVQASTSWLATGSGIRQLWVTRQVLSGGNYGVPSKLDGGMSQNDLSIAGEYTEMTMSTFQAFNAGDLINLYVRHRSAALNGQATSAGSTMSMTFISPL